MNIWEIFIISFGLAMDCFAVAISIGTNSIKKTSRMVLRLAFHFGLFQGAMAFIGWFAGKQVADYIAKVDHWVAFLLLLWVGGKMIIGSFKAGYETEQIDLTRGGSLVMLSLATSIDALAVGLSLALVDGSIMLNSLIIGVFSFVLSIAGYLVGNRLGRHFGHWMQLLGGALLILIGLRVLLSHLGIM
ncbi:MAG: manganese efflux pump [Anaerolineaceae bacterium]|nr:manganese efflux pump [Anaerolineaceae bacterium]